MNDLTPSDLGRLMGRIGGKSTLLKYGKAHFSNAGKLGMASRWKDHQKGLSNPLKNGNPSK